MSRVFALVCASLCLLISSSSARAESLFLAAPIMQYDINVIKVDTKYTVSNVASKIGKLSVTGTPTWLGSPSNVISNGSYTVTIFFDLVTGLPRLGDANKIEVTGKIANVQQTFFLSTMLKLFGSGSEDTIDVVFGNNQGNVQPGSDIMTRIMGVS